SIAMRCTPAARAGSLSASRGVSLTSNVPFACDMGTSERAYVEYVEMVARLARRAAHSTKLSLGRMMNFRRLLEMKFERSIGRADRKNASAAMHDYVV